MGAELKACPFCGELMRCSNCPPPAEKCEGGCSAPVVTHDNEGVPLCQECADELRRTPAEGE